MDNIFGIGLPEFVLILVIAGMVMGPERIARSARSLGLLTARLQTISRSFFRQLNAELDSVDQDGQIKSTVEELNLLRRQVADLRNEVFSLASGAASESKQAVREIKSEMKNSILPPGLNLGAENPPATSGTTATGPITGGAAPVYRPPSLFSEESGGTGAAPAANGLPQSPPPMKLPNRVDVAEDPDG